MPQLSKHLTKPGETNLEAINKSLLNIEAWAEGLRNECHKARLLIKGDVSTSPAGQKQLDPKIITEVLMRRHRQMIKNRPLKTVKP